MFSIIGGLLLCIGAYLIFKGKVFKASIFYLFADTIWIYLSYSKYINSNSIYDLIGLILVITGSILGILAFLKMNKGKMRKTLDF